MVSRTISVLLETEKNREPLSDYWSHLPDLQNVFSEAEEILGLENATEKVKQRGPTGELEMR